MYRFFTPHPLTIDTPIELEEEELRHLKKVLRVRPMEKIELVNGKGQLAQAMYDDPITILSVHSATKPERKATLIQALPEKGHLEWILEKATEIGITEFWLFPAERSKLQEISPASLSRMKKITISALKQSKRLFLPSIYPYHHKEELKELSGNLYLADPKGAPFFPSPQSSSFIVGPESGFTPHEIDFFQNTCKATPTTLSTNILRTETAAIVASFLISS